MKRHFDYTLLLMTLLLVGLGLTMIYSASAILAKERMHDSLYFLKRELAAVVLGMIGLVVARLLPLKIFQKMVYPFLGVTLVLMLAVFIPSLGSRVGGATRWLRLGPVSLQPSEFAKLALIFFLSYVLSKKKEKIKAFAVGFMPPTVLAGLLIGLVLLGKDLGNGAVMAVTFFALMYVGGARLSFLFSEFLLSLPALYMLIASEGYRRRRILAFLNPWAHEKGAGFQIIQSYVAFHSGNFFGQGLGEGKQKLFYLPEAHTDFIFSVIGEELGLLGTFAIMTLFLIWLFRALRIVVKAPDLFSRYLALGIGTMIGFQAVFNMGVVMGLFPTKGLPLPFISYGGTSMVVSLFCVGILLNISSQGKV